MNKALVPKNKDLTGLSPLQLYLREVAKHPLLTPEEEYDLAQQHYETGSPAAAHRLITSNLRLVVKIASDFRKIRGELLDLIQEGNTGLMQAVKRFNPYKGVRLSSYAVWWIRAYILKYLLDNERQVKIATTSAQRKLFYNLRQETEKLLREYDRADTKLLAQRLQVSEKDIIEMRKRMSAHDISLDAPVAGEGGRALTTGDLIADHKQLPADAWVAQAQVKTLFRSYIKEFAVELPARELDILQSRILSETPLTLQQLGDKYRVTRERARQIEGRVIQKLKQYLAQRGLLEGTEEEGGTEVARKPKKARTSRKSRGGNKQL